MLVVAGEKSNTPRIRIVPVVVVAAVAGWCCRNAALAPLQCCPGLLVFIQTAGAGAEAGAGAGAAAEEVEAAVEGIDVRLVPGWGKMEWYGKESKDLS